MSYAPHDALTAPARARPELWRLGVGMALIVVIFVGLDWSFYALIQIFAGTGAYVAAVIALTDTATPLGALVTLFRFAFLLVAVAVVARNLHGRPGIGLIGSPRRALMQGLRVFAALSLLYLAVALLPPYGAPAEVKPGLPPGRWLVLLPFSLLAILVQTSAEEVLFRGYLQQHLAARFVHPAFWLGLPSALFAALHYVPSDMGENAGFIVAWSLIFALAAADLTARSGSLGPAIALHMVNNVSAILLTAIDGSFSGLALFLLSVDPSDAAAMRPLLWIDLLLLVCSWLAARLALRV